VKDWGESASELMIGEKKTITRSCTQYSLTWSYLGVFTFCMLYSNLSRAYCCYF